jgi:hypothetical protein
MRALAARLLATLPPGKVRFTFIDPVGLGQNVAAFMKLTDHDESLVTSKAWSEPHHIEQQLAALSEHMENVIQKYLRAQFRTSRSTTPRPARWPNPTACSWSSTSPPTSPRRRRGGW